MMDLYATVSVGERANLGKHDFVAFPSASGQGCAEKWFFSKQADNYRNDFILWDL